MEHRRNCAFNVSSFQGMVLATMNAPQAEEIAEFLLSFKKDEIPATVHAFACGMNQNAKDVRRYLAEKKRKANGQTVTRSDTQNNGDEDEDFGSGTGG